MILYGLILFAALAGICWLGRQAKRDVSDAWLSDQRRREYGSGVDGISWRWPIVRLCGKDQP